MDQRFLTGSEFQQLIVEDKFKKTNSVDMVERLNFKHFRMLMIKIKSQSCDKNPFDGFVWSKTTFTKEKKVENRHQPTYSKIEINGEKVQSIRCTDYNQDHIHKQVVAYGDFTYIYYFSTCPDRDIVISDAETKKLDKPTKEKLKTTILPMRNVTNALKVARGLGIDVSRKQLANLARSTSDVIVGKSGPRSKTTLKMVEELERLHPERVWYEKNDANILTDFTYIHVFVDGCRIFFKGCPSEERWNFWVEKVDELMTVDEETRKKTIKRVLSKNEGGVFFPSRLHVDTTFNLGDVYVTVVLGETRHFKTKSSMKHRVVPVGYMLHSSKEAENHRKFATALKDEFAKLATPTEHRKFPCVLMDGESSLELYPQILDSSAIRCDLHILSLLRYNYGGKAAVHQAKPLLFGKMKNGTWRCGLLGCFDMATFNRRLQRIANVIDPKISSWLESNKIMLMESASAYAKLRAGHILQYSTNNQNETFNGIIKASLSRRQALPELIRKLDECCEGKLRECWLSALDVSEYVVFAKDVDGATLEEKIEAFSTAGLLAPLILALNVPPRIAEGFDLRKVYQEDLALKSLQLLNKTENTFHLVNTDLPENDLQRYIHVVVSDNSMIDCLACSTTLPAYLCCHIMFCLSMLNDNAVEDFWTMLISNKKSSTRAPNTFSARSGMKLSDRIGCKQSARNHVRTVLDMSSSSFGSETSEMSQMTVAQHNGTSSPVSESSSYPSTSARMSQPRTSQASSTLDVTFSPTTPEVSSQRRTSRRIRRTVRSYTPSPQRRSVNNSSISSSPGF